MNAASKPYPIPGGSSRPLRLLHIVPSISQVYGGPSQMVLGFSRALAQQGVEVTILTTHANGDRGQPPLNVPLDRPVEQDGYQIRYFRCAPFRRYKFSLDLLRWFAHHAHEYNGAHIHALFSPVSTAAATIARHRQLPYILRPLGTLDPADLRKKRHLKRLYATWFERANLAGATAVHFTSDQEAAISQRFGATTRDWVLPLGVDPDPVHDSAADSLLFSYPADTPLLLFMSRLDPKKGLDLLLPALTQLQTEGVRFHCVIAGANPQDPAYEQHIATQIHASSIAPYITLTGFASGELKAALLQTADVFVLPSYYENFGIAVAEAMVAGVPVVISDQVHIWREIQAAAAGWICACEVSSLTQQLRHALLDASMRKQRGLNARAYARQHYNWETIAQRAIRAYHHYLEPSRTLEDYLEP